MAAARTSPTCPTSTCELATEPNGDRRRGQRRLPPLPARPRDAGPAVGGPRHAGPRAPRRRHREGRRHRQHLLRPRQPRPHDARCARRRSTGSPPRSPRSRSTTRTATPRCSCSAGARPTARSPPPRDPLRAQGLPGRAGPPAPPQPVPGQHRRGAARYRRVIVPEMNLGQLAMLLRAKYLVDVQSHTSVRGLPFSAAELEDVIQKRSDRMTRHVDAGPTSVCRATGSTGVPHPSRGRDRRRPARTSPPTRRCAGAPAAATTPSSPPCRASCPSSGLRRENIVFVSGIGCSSRFPYYLDTYGMHSIHGRAPAIATGLADLATGPVGVGRHRRRRRAVDRRQPPDPRAAPQRQPQDPAVQQPDLRPDQGAVLPHLARSARSPSRRRWARVDHPFNPVSLALGAEATFVARTMDSDRKHLTEVLRAAAAHRGTALVEIYQNCPIFNDGVVRRAQGPRRGARPGSSTSPTARRSPPASTVVVRRDDGSARRRARATRPTRPGSCATTPTPTTRRWRSRSPASTTRAWRTSRWGSSATSSGPTYDDLVRAQIDGTARARAVPRPTRTSPTCSPAGTRGWSEQPGRRDRQGGHPAGGDQRGTPRRAAARRHPGVLRLPALGPVPPVLPRAGARRSLGDPRPPDPVDLRVLPAAAHDPPRLVVDPAVAAPSAAPRRASRSPRCSSR